jgi:U3 small nucleolar RNA-associated protein 4
MNTEKQGTQQKEEGGGKSRYALLWGANWLIKLPLSLSTTGGHPLTSRKRRRPQQDQVDVQTMTEESLTNSSSRLVTHYRPILHVDFLDDGELVIVERPLVDVLRTLPPAYFKHKYGSS